jgi:hypothetical protein
MLAFEVEAIAIAEEEQHEIAVPLSDRSPKWAHDRGLRWAPVRQRLNWPVLLNPTFDIVHKTRRTESDQSAQLLAVRSRLTGDQWRWLRVCPWIHELDH